MDEIVCFSLNYNIRSKKRQFWFVLLNSLDEMGKRFLTSYIKATDNMYSKRTDNDHIHVWVALPVSMPIIQKVSSRACRSIQANSFCNRNCKVASTRFAFHPVVRWSSERVVYPLSRHTPNAVVWSLLNSNGTDCTIRSLPVWTILNPLPNAANFLTARSTSSLRIQRWTINAIVRDRNCHWKTLSPQGKKRW